ncbi:hypothetical protein [Pseudoduganella namucuonensis]|uniref:Uncharacterized protein n=1 Tax=Pseudoduganella namucuonensis TaxID=1035707 RepID=A0A1I7M2W4_9BURK|nr:hypothetical protein [Pseudoduganella namucuonensis]SFV16187.1 hypothetical protein SAMN05216552_105029 [Pseudoduganella namucuonensis]
MAPKIAVTIMFGALLTGCAARYSPTPLATDFPASRQYQLQAAAHWGAIAGHLEKGLTDGIRKGPQRPVYVAEPSSKASPFERALATHITSILVRNGYVVSRHEAGSLKVDIDVQALVFSPDRVQTRFEGEVAVIAPGVLAVAALPPAGAAMAIAGAYEFNQFRQAHLAAGGTPKTELIVTVSVSDQYRYYARNSSAYYVSEGDRSLYGIPDDPADVRHMKTFQVRGDK